MKIGNLTNLLINKYKVINGEVNHEALIRKLSKLN